MIKTKALREWVRMHFDIKTYQIILISLGFFLKYDNAMFVKNMNNNTDMNLLIIWNTGIQCTCS